MTIARAGAAAAPLRSGKVLILGGMDQDNPVATAEVFDPASGTFNRAAGTMKVGRWFPVAATLHNGKVLVAGGLALGGVLATAELYNPATQRFSSAGLGSMTTPREGPVAVTLPDGKVLIAGGIGPNGNFLDSAELFDPTTGKFSSDGLGSMTTARLLPGAALLPGGRVLIAGGTPDEQTRLASAEVFVSAPEASARPLVFAARAFGTRSRLRWLTVRNVGAQVLAITGVRLRGAGAGSFTVRAGTCVGQQLSFGQSCRLRVRFSPKRLGPVTATVVLRDNDPQPARIRVSGVGFGIP
jgi:hypothetical protein